MCFAGPVQGRVKMQRDGVSVCGSPERRYNSGARNRGMNIRREHPTADPLPCFF